MKKITAQYLLQEINYPVHLFLWNGMTKMFLLKCFVSDENKHFQSVKADIENEEFKDISEDEAKEIILAFLSDFNIHFSIKESEDKKYYCSYRTNENYSMMLAHGERYSASLLFHGDTYIETLIYLYMNILIHYSDDLLEKHTMKN
jgi:hypothetical protein